MPFQKFFYERFTFDCYHVFLKLHNIMYFSRLQYKTQAGHRFLVFSHRCHCESIYQGIWSQPRLLNQVKKI